MNAYNGRATAVLVVDCYMSDAGIRRVDDDAPDDAELIEVRLRFSGSAYYKPGSFGRPEDSYESDSGVEIEEYSSSHEGIEPTEEEFRRAERLIAKAVERG